MKWLARPQVSPASPYMCLCLSEKDYVKAMEHCKPTKVNPWLNKGADATTHLLVNDDGARVAVVCINAGKHKKADVLSLLVHEAAHIWQDYAESFGEARPGDEQEAYAIQGISKVLIADYLRRSKR